MPQRPWDGRWPHWLTTRLQPADLAVLVAGFVVVTLLGVGFAELLDGVLDGEGIGGVDKPVNAFLAAHRTPATTSVFSAITTVGGPIVLSGLVAVVVALVGWRMRTWRPVWVAVVALGGAELFVLAIKQLVERSRPDAAIAAATADGYSFPSGHATGSTVGFGLLAWLAVTLFLTRPAARVAVWAAAAALAAAVGVSRMYLGVHYLSDVLGGWALGAAWLAIVLVAVTTLTHLRQRPPSPLATPAGR